MGHSFKKIIMIAASIIILVGAVFTLYPYFSALNGSSTRNKINLHQTDNNPTDFYIQNRGIEFKVKIADTDYEREEGLAGTFYINDNEGMLFIFNKPGYYQMWMKGMLYPLDIIWLDESFKIIDIRRNVKVSNNLETYGPSSPAEYVLEINSGLVDKYGFMIGDIFRAVDSKNDF